MSLKEETQTCALYPAVTAGTMSATETLRFLDYSFIRSYFLLED